MVFESTILRDAVMNATYNVNRKKSKPFKKLWTRIIRMTKGETKKRKDAVSTIEEIEKKERGWINKIYAANGFKRKKKGG